MKNLFILLFLVLFIQVRSQTNFAQNGDFETFSSPSCASSPVAGPGQQSNIESYWSQVSKWIVPSKQSRFCFTSVATPDYLCLGGNKGPHCARMLNGEFISEPMISNLTSGKCYYVEYFIKTPGINTLNARAGLRFLNGRPMQCGYKKLKKGNGAAHVPADPSVVVADTWTKIQGYYVDAINASWLSFGHQNPTKKKYDNLNPAPNTFHIDDVKIIDIGPGFCPQYNYIQNMTFADIGEVIFRSQNLTSSGFNVDGSQPSGNVYVQNTSTVTFRSATEVALLPGFNAESGCIFNAYIKPCNNDCPNLNISAGDDFDFCGSYFPIQLGGSPVQGQTYSWSVLPISLFYHPNAMSYLSSSTIANPIFTPPSGEFAITYQLTVTNPCGETSYEQITITGDPSPTSTSGGLIIYNFTSSFNNVDFWIQFSSHTQNVLIQILDAGNVIGEFELEAGIDFAPGATNVHWSNHDVWPNCKNLEVRALVQNFCDNNMSSYVSNNTWINTPSTSLNVTNIPNIFTPDGDNVNDCFAVTVNGAQSVDLLIKNQYGATMHQKNHGLVNGYNCLWNGYCDAGGPGCLCNCLVVDGTYFYVMDFKDCSGNVINSYNGYVQKLGQPGMRLMNTAKGDSINSLTSINENISEHLKETLVFPNPASNQLNVVVKNSEQKEALKYEVYDSTGKLIKSGALNSMETSVDISEFSSGLYSISIKSLCCSVKRNFVKE